MTNLTLSVSLPLLTYNVFPGWTVSLIDTPGFGEANEHVQQLAEDSVEVSAAYIYLIQTENIGGVEISEMFAFLAKKDPDAVYNSTNNIQKYSMLLIISKSYYLLRCFH